MTPNQQTALAALAGRALTEAEIEAIDALLPARRDADIAAVLSVGRTRLQPRLISERGVMSALGIVAGEAFLQGVESFVAEAPAQGHPLAAAWAGIKRAAGWLKGEGIDLGDALTQQLLAAMGAAGVVDAGSAATLAALGRVADPITPGQVSGALNVLEG